VRASERGLTLIEVMVSLLLSSLVIAGAYSVMLVQQRMSSQQTQIQGAQQVAWTAMELLQRDIRRAGMGFGFCRYQEASGRVNAAVVEVWRRHEAAASRLYAIEVDNNYGNAGPDRITLAWGDPRGAGAADVVLEAHTNPIWTLTSLNLQQPTTNPQESFMYPFGCDCSGTCTRPGAGGNPMPLALIYVPPTRDTTGAWTTPPVACSVVQVKDTTCGGALDIAAGANALWNRASGGAGGTAYNTTASRALNIGSITRMRWYVQSTASSPCDRPPCLMRVPVLANDTEDTSSLQLMAVGVEDLQVVPGCDWHTAGTMGAEGTDTGTKQADDWLYNVASDTVPNPAENCKTFPYVRVSLVVRTTSADPSFVGIVRPALEDHAAGTATDKYRRRVLSAVVRPPNVDFFLGQ
jgi:prepilin-type N-terminal cleavage/methylation domain-containing protein